LAAAEQILGEDVVSQRVQSQRKWYLIATFVLAVCCGYGLGSLYV
jgi:general secretion pathway protein A